eukprot:COSAG02_NODE_21411_length_789_cov_0.839130_2_plen_140_part_00
MVAHGETMHQVAQHVYRCGKTQLQLRDTPTGCVPCCGFVDCRYVMHGSGGHNDGHNIRFGTELADIIQQCFPGIKVGSPKMVKSDGTPFFLPAPTQISDSKKAKELLGVTLRPAEETIRDCVESSIDLGLITVQLQAKM